MTEEIRIGKRRRYLAFEAKKPRERNACPKCGSMLVRKRVITKDYKCNVCGWIGVSVIKVMW